MTVFFSARHKFPGFEFDIKFEAPGRGVTALFGPSGAGKSTVLAIAAGLLRPEQCHFGIDGVVLADSESDLWLPPERRRVGLVFQDARLFPHMPVDANLRYGLRRRTAKTIEFDTVVELLGLAALLARRPHTLSGGERQRVAIGRALLSQPHLLLMDEPLASLDAARKADILPYLARLPAALGLPIFYVTHAFDEVVRLADALVLIDGGKVVASGKLSDLAARADLPIATRDDAAAVLDCTVAEHDTGRGLTRLICGTVNLLVAAQPIHPGAKVRVRIAAREVILAHGDTRGLAESISLHNILPGTVRSITADAARHTAMVEIDLGGPALLARVTTDAVSHLELAKDAPVLALIKSMSVEVLPIVEEY